MAYHYFIFDLDGTLAYTIGDLCAAMNGMLSYFGWRTITEEEALQNINFGARQFVRGCLPEEYRENETMVDLAFAKYAECYGKGYLNTTHLYPDIAEGVAYLKEKGARLAVFSNKQDAQTKALCQKLFPPATFDVVMGFNGAFPHKPAPDGALAIAIAFGCRPEEVAFVGDSDVDMKTAQNAGMHPIGVSWGYRSKELLLSCGAEKILSDLRDIQDLIEG
jgi:phosphoglycolate phosphatase